jgi:hypothetical protein
MNDFVCVCVRACARARVCVWGGGVKNLKGDGHALLQGTGTSQLTQ